MVNFDPRGAEVQARRAQRVNLQRIVAAELDRRARRAIMARYALLGVVYVLALVAMFLLLA